MSFMCERATSGHLWTGFSGVRPEFMCESKARVKCRFKCARSHLDTEESCKPLGHLSLTATAQIPREGKEGNTVNPRVREIKGVWWGFGQRPQKV